MLFSHNFVVMCCFKFIYAVFLRYLLFVFFSLANDDTFALLLVYGVMNWIDVHVLFFWHAVARYFSGGLIEYENILTRCTLRLMTIFSAFGLLILCLTFTVCIFFRLFCHNAEQLPTWLLDFTVLSLSCCDKTGRFFLRPGGVVVRSHMWGEPVFCH